MKKITNVKKSIGVAALAAAMFAQTLTLTYMPVYADTLGIVTDDYLNVRSGASTSNAIIGELSSGTTVEILGTEGDWYKISYDGGTAYVYSDYVTTEGGTSAKTTEGVNLRASASTSSAIVDTVNKGTSLTIFSTEGDFSRVSVNGKTGYIYSEYLSTDTSSAGGFESTSSETGYVNENYVNFRSTPSTSGEILNCFKKDTQVTILGTQGDWVKLSVDNVVGYMYGEYVSQDGAGVTSMSDTDAYVNVDWLNVRSGASTNNKILRTIPKNTAVVLTGKTGDWYRVEVGSTEGYVFGIYVTEGSVSSSSGSTSTIDNVTFENVNETVWATDDVNIRKGPSTSYGIYANLKTNRSITRTGIGSNGWSRVDYGNTVAYINSEWLTTTEPEETTGTGTPSNGSVTGDQIVDFALRWVGYPYVYGGNNLSTGVDCSSFTQLVYAEFGVTIPRTAEPQAEIGVTVPLDSLQKGDLVFYPASDGTVGHVVIYIGGNQVVHASTPSAGIIISNLYYRQPLWAKRVL